MAFLKEVDFGMVLRDKGPLLRGRDTASTIYGHAGRHRNLDRCLGTRLKGVCIYVNGSIEFQAADLEGKF